MSYKMNPDIKKKWIEALRGGKYEQGGWYLKSNGGYCCLGVLCDIYIKENGISWVDPKNQYTKKFDKKFDKNCNQKGEKRCMGCSTHLPKEVIEWAGLYNSDPYLNFEGTKQAISAWNDGPKYLTLSKKSFAELADAIEEQL